MQSIETFRVCLHLDMSVERYKASLVFRNQIVYIPGLPLNCVAWLFSVMQPVIKSLHVIATNYASGLKVLLSAVLRVMPVT